MPYYVPPIVLVLLVLIIAWIIGSGIAWNRRKIGAALSGTFIRSTCCGATTTPKGWTQDGWVSVCDKCGSWQYLGDDFDNPPPGFHLRDARINSKPYAEPRLIPWGKKGSYAYVDEIAADPETYDRLLLSEVTSVERCELCDQPVSEHDFECPRRILEEAVTRDFQDEGEPAKMPPQPNIGGEGHPDYAGPHYDVPHTDFVPYDVLGDPEPGRAVRIVGEEDNEQDADNS